MLGINLAQTEMKYINANDDYDLFVVSIGSGSLSGDDVFPYNYFSKNTIFEVTKRLLLTDPFRMTTQVVKTHEKVKHVCGKDRKGKGANYYRLQFKIDEQQYNKLDDVTDDNLDTLIKCADQVLESNEMNELIDDLIQPVNRPLYQNRLGLNTNIIITRIKKHKI